VVERDTHQLEKVQAPFPRIHYNDAVEAAARRGMPFEWGGDFGGTDETVLSEQYDGPVFVTNYPAAVKAFYMEPDPHDRGSACRATAWRPRATARSSAAASAWRRSSC
jgi:asparaginyl-tRNA synthetase